MRGIVDPAYFGLEKGKKVPSSVLLTQSAADLAFSSLALKTWVGDPSDGVGLYKLFSRYVIYIYIYKYIFICIYIYLFGI